MAGRFRALLLTPVFAVMLMAAAWAESLVLEVMDAKAGFDERARFPILTIRLTPASREAFARLTSENLGRKAEMRIDGKVVMTPVIREPILAGTLQISGITADEARSLASRLSAGDAKIEVEVVPD